MRSETLTCSDYRGFSKVAAQNGPRSAARFSPKPRINTLSKLRSIVGKLPRPLKKRVLNVVKQVRVAAFDIPDPMIDLQRLANLRHPDAILDIGAHHGQTAEELRAILGPTPIHCFEPFPESFRALESNTSTLSDVHTHPLALSDTDGTASFHSNANSQTNSLLDNDTDNNRMPAATAHRDQVTVQTSRLDTFTSVKLRNQRLFIKADVQGAELRLIEGGRDTLAKMTDVFYTEVSLARLYKDQGDLFSIHRELTETLPFVLYQIYRTRSDAQGRAMWSDAMWIHRDFAAQLED